MSNSDEVILSINKNLGIFKKKSGPGDDSDLTTRTFIAPDRIRTCFSDFVRAAHYPLCYWGGAFKVG
jgi:hypothetical protein